MSGVTAAWPRLMDALHGARARFDAACQRAPETQAAVLAEILQANRDTAFGRQHRFGALRNERDFHNAVPPQSYEDLAPYIERMAAGTPAQLTAEAPVAFERTGGSTGGAKLIPYTPSGLAALQRGIHAWLEDLFLSRPAIRAGRMYFAISPAARSAELTKGGTPIGFATDAAYLGGQVGAAIAPLLIAPPAQMDISAWRDATVAALTGAPDLSLVSVWSPTFLLELWRNAGSLPEPDTISCWTSASSASFAQRLAKLFPRSHLQGKGLLATEGVVTVPLCRVPYPVLTVESGYYELVPSGSDYEVLLTTHSGLYRYRLGDRVAIRGWHGQAPQLEFLGRAGAVSDLCGEKLTEAFVLPFLHSIDGFRLLAPVSSACPHYALYLDQAEHDVADSIALAHQLDQQLGANPQYAYARQLGQLGAVEPVRIAHALEQYHQAACRSGRLLGNVKPPGFSHEPIALPV